MSCKTGCPGTAATVNKPVYWQTHDAVDCQPALYGDKGMNAELKEFHKKQFPNSKSSDLFAIFIERNLDPHHRCRYGCREITMQSWMFLSPFEGIARPAFWGNTPFWGWPLRSRLDSIGGEVVFHHRLCAGQPHLPCLPRGLFPTGELAAPGSRKATMFKAVLR